MIVEVKYAEIDIEPETILVQALQEGDISIDAIIRECISEEGADAVLDAIDNDDITSYSKRFGLADELPNLDAMVLGVRELDQEDKAKLLWLLLKG
jgi:hypothetical protein